VSPATGRGQQPRGVATLRAASGCVRLSICTLILLSGEQAAAISVRHERLGARLARAERLAPPDSEEALSLALTFPLRDQGEWVRLVAEQHTPGSARYHRWLTPSEFAARFAPSSQTYETTVNWLRDQGFTVRSWPTRLRIDFSGTVRTVERSFRVGMDRYRVRDRSVVVPRDQAALPVELASHIAALRLDTVPLGDPVARVFVNGSLEETMGPGDMQMVYGVRPLLERGIDGAGQVIAVVARSDFRLDDTRGFQLRFGLPQRDPVKVFVGGNPGVGAINGVCRNITDPVDRLVCVEAEKTEVQLDVQWAAALAPGATVLVDIGRSDIDAALMDVVTHHPEAKVVTISFGICERLDPTALAFLAPAYAQAAAQGQTVLVSAGNTGADGCVDGGPPGVNALASDGNVVSVGGSSLDPGFDANGDATAHVAETVWNDRSGAGGGGRSLQVSKPAYQAGPGVPNDRARDQPDVVLLASPVAPGYAMVLDGEPLIIGGTSAAAPTWGGIVALLNHATGADGLGVLNNALYEVGRRQYGGYGVLAFHDLTQGSNSFNGVAGFTAQAGFDLASGLGAPDAAVLAQAIVALALVGDCTGDGTVNVEDLVLGTGVALGRLSFAACRSMDRDGDGGVTVDELVGAIAEAAR
jgi:subtilase family serine protease